VNEENNNNNNNNSLIYDAKNSKSIIVVKDSNLQLSESSPPLSSLSIDIVDTVNKKKDERLELLLISKGLIEILQDAGFTIETRVESGPSHIATILGIDM
jgi:hypothetical protein